MLLAAVCAGSFGEARADTAKTIDLGTFQAQVTAAETLAAACRAAAAGCQSSGLPGAEQVSGAGGVPTFAVEWAWLREAIDAARTEPGPIRVAEMTAATAHLGELTRETRGDAATDRPEPFPLAREAARGVLARGEFQAAAGPSWLDRQIAKMQDWFFRLLMGMGRIGSRNPWLAAAVEWVCFLLAAGGLVYFVRRSLSRQALRIALGEGAATAQRDMRDSEDWARMAEACAAAAEWREGVHCLYWAAVVSLEGRRAWKPNPTRTPREYLRLLRPGSEAQRSLRELTRSFERVWYGQAKATETDFRAAEASYRAIQAADLRRDEMASLRTAPGAA